MIKFEKHSYTYESDIILLHSESLSCLICNNIFTAPRLLWPFLESTVSKWEKYKEIFFSSIKDSNTVGEIKKIEKCNNTERSEFLLKDKKENIFIRKDENIPVRACGYRKITDGKNILGGRKPSNDIKRRNNVVKKKIPAIVSSIRTYADVVNNKNEGHKIKLVSFSWVMVTH